MQAGLETVSLNALGRGKERKVTQGGWRTGAHRASPSLEKREAAKIVGDVSLHLGKLSFQSWFSGTSHQGPGFLRKI